MNSKVRTVGYWAATGLVAFGFAMGGAMDLAHPAALTADMARLGYPAYFMTILGAWKVLGALAIVAPRAARVKEWAYAGMAFDLTGAAFSHVASGDGPSKWVAPLVLLALVVTSWALRPASRVLEGAREGAASERAPGKAKVALAA